MASTRIARIYDPSELKVTFIRELDKLKRSKTPLNSLAQLERLADAPSKLSKSDCGLYQDIKEEALRYITESTDIAVEKQLRDAIALILSPGPKPKLITQYMVAAVAGVSRHNLHTGKYENIRKAIAALRTGSRYPGYVPPKKLGPLVKKKMTYEEYYGNRLWMA